MKSLFLTALLALAACTSTPAPPMAPAPDAGPATLQDYRQRASFMIRQNLDLGLVNTSTRGSFEATIQLLFDATGKFQGVKWQERSGNPVFEMALESAARKAVGQLPPPPVPAGLAGTLAMPMRFQLIR